MLVPILLILLCIVAACLGYKIWSDRRYPEVQRIAVNHVRTHKTDPAARERDYAGSHGVDHFSKYMVTLDVNGFIAVMVKTIYFRGGAHNGMQLHIVIVDPQRASVVSCVSVF